MCLVQLAGKQPQWMQRMCLLAAWSGSTSEECVMYLSLLSTLLCRLKSLCVLGAAQKGEELKKVGRRCRKCTKSDSEESECRA